MGRLLFVVLFVSAPLAAHAQHSGPKADLPFDPPTYYVHRTTDPLVVDGLLEETAWRQAEWTAPFGDIRGGGRPEPKLRTRAKMLWDEDHLYVAAEMDEPDLWATRTTRDTVVYLDDAFEVFIDPTGDTHAYYELQVNALETVRDLFLVMPFRDGGPSIGAWNLRGIKTGAELRGTLNDPADTDEGWTLELALPWAALKEAAPEGRRPRPGEQWRLNLARPDWPLEVVGEAYQKREGASTEWWTWAPQGEVDLHMPERFGYVQFVGPAVGASGKPPNDPEKPSGAQAPNEQVKWALRQLYYRQRDYYETNGRYASDLAELNAEEISIESGGGTQSEGPEGTGGETEFEPTLEVTQSAYEITAPGAGGTTVHIRHDGKVWTTAD